MPDHVHFLMIVRYDRAPHEAAARFAETLARELAADRLLILSGFTNTTPHISALAMRRDPAAAHLFRANCLAMNDLAAALCEQARERL